MNRLKSTNMLYLVGILPLWLAVCGVGILLVPVLWGKLLAGGIGLAACLWLCHKVACLPRPRREYKDLVPLELSLPGGCQVSLYTSEQMARYDFLHRTVELIRPLISDQEHPVTLVVNPELLRQEGEEFVQIAAMREIESHRRHEQLRTVLGLVLPILGVALAVELAVLAHRMGWLPNSSLLMMMEPAVAVALLVGALYRWNRSVSNRDFLMDQAMTAYFTKEQLVRYLRREQTLEQQNEDIHYSTHTEERHQLHQHYITERIEHLRAQ